MAETTLQLGFVPKERGEYTSGATYYKDNVVQYNGSSYIADPVGWSELHPTDTYVTIAPTDASGNLNAGWRIFASGNNTFTTGEKVDNVGIDDEPTAGSDNLVKSGGVFSSIKQQSDKIDSIYNFGNIQNSFLAPSLGGFVLSNTCLSCLVPISPNDNCILYGSTFDAAFYAFLKSDTNFEAGGTPDYCSGTTRRTVTRNEYITLIAPQDARYLWFSVKYDNVSYIPTSLIINGVNIMGNIFDAIRGAAEQAKQTAEELDSRINTTNTNLENLKEDTLTYIEILERTITEGYINITNGKYYIYSTPNMFYGALINVSGVEKIKLVPTTSSSQDPSSYAFLQNDTLVADQTPTYATGYSNVITLTETVNVDVPVDAQYLWVYYRRGSIVNPDIYDICSGTQAYQKTQEEFDGVHTEINNLADNSGIFSELSYDSTTEGYISSDDGKYYIYSTPNMYYGGLVNVSEIKRLKMIPHNVGSATSSYAFLQNNILVANQTPTYATGYNNVVSLTETTTVDVPSDANYVWIYIYRTKNIKPDVSGLLPVSNFLPTKFNGVLVSSVMGVHGFDNRFMATKQIYDIALKVIENEDYVPMDSELSLADYGAVAILPGIPASYGTKQIKFLFAKGASTLVAPASTTKVMSAITGLDYISSIKEQVTLVSSDIESGSGFTLYAGDILTIEDILYGMMLPSSNTCAKAFARTVGEKSLNMKGVTSPTVQECRDEFIVLMNRKAELLGMVDSTFITPSGVDSTQQNLSSSRDLLRMTIEACSYPDLCRIWGKDSYTFTIGGNNTRQETLTRVAFPQEFTEKYQYLGCKSGSLSYETWSTNTFVCVAEVL